MIVIKTHLVVDLFGVLLVHLEREVLQAAGQTLHAGPVLETGRALTGEIVLGQISLSGLEVRH